MLVSAFDRFQVYNVNKFWVCPSQALCFQFPGYQGEVGVERIHESRAAEVDWIIRGNELRTGGRFQEPPFQVPDRRIIRILYVSGRIGVA